MTAESFIKELKLLIDSKPNPPVRISNSEDSQGDYIYHSKNLLNCFDCANCTNSLYLYDSYMCANSVDCDYAVESELCYESVDPFKCFNCEYLENCSQMTDSSYSYACTNCHDVFGSVNLKNKSFCIFNRQLTEAKYKERAKQFKSLPSEKVLKMLDQLKELYPWTQTNEENNENSAYGNYIYHNKNCYLCFDASHNENCGYLYDSFYNTACYDLTYSSHTELSCEAVDSDKLFNCNFAVYSSSCLDSSYIFNCFDVKNSLGCVGLSHKQYCILNRQLSKEEYEKTSRLILNDIKSKNLGWSNLSF